MDKKQMEMLSVKSAVERMVHNYISTYKELRLAQTAGRNDFIDEVKRMMSSFYTGRQVDNWTVTDEYSSIDITFEVNGHKTLVTFLLPPELKLADPTRSDYDPRALTEVFYSTLEKPMRVADKTENKVKGELSDLDYFANKRFVSKPIPASYYVRPEVPRSALSNIPEEPKKEQKFWDGEQWKTESELLKIAKAEVNAKKRELKGTWKLETPEELRAAYGLDDEEELKQAIAADLVKDANYLNWCKEGEEDPVVCGDIYYDTAASCVRVFDGERWVPMSADYLREHATNETNIRVTSSGSLEMFKNGKWVQLPKSNGATPSVVSQPADPVSEPKVEDEFDPFEAYERAKKAVRNMG